MQSTELSRFVPEDANVSDQKQWQLAEIEKGMAEAERGEFASEDEMRALYRKWRVRR